jgi:hypothetical protein
MRTSRPILLLTASILCAGAAACGPSGARLPPPPGGGAGGTGAGGAGAAGGADAGAEIPDAPPDGPFEPAPHRDFPQVPDNGGPVLAPMRLVTVVAQNDDLQDQLFAFGDALVTSAWWTAVGLDYGLGVAGPSVHVVGPAIAPGTTLDQPTFTQYVTDAIQGGPEPDGRTMYMLYLPEGVDVYYAPKNGVNTNCQFVGGFHRRYLSGGDGIGIAQRCPLSPGVTQIQQLTHTGSHEILEGATDTNDGWAITLPQGADPWTGSIWLEDEGNSHVELGDLCGGTRITEGSFVYSRIFSNSAATLGGDPCRPALPIPYYSTTAPQDWYTGAAGTTVSIPITGWSTAPVDDWIIRAAIPGQSDPSLSFGALIDSPTTTTIGGTLYKTTNNGRSATLEVSVPPDAPSGAWVSVLIHSKRLDASGATPAGKDFHHDWIVGVHVP